MPKLKFPNLMCLSPDEFKTNILLDKKMEIQSFQRMLEKNCKLKELIILHLPILRLWALQLNTRI